MTIAMVAKSSFTTALMRYSRSWGLWLLLLVGPIGARFFVSRDDGSAVVIAIGDHLPVLTSAMLGISLGITLSTLLVPIAFIYLRSNTNRRQAWQIEEVSPASRIGIALGRFGADVAVLFAVLCGLNLAGWLLGYLLIDAEPFSLWQISFALWLVAASAVMGLAAIRILFDALPWTRGALGDFLYLCTWLASIAVPAAADKMAPGFAANMFDFAGFVRPLVYGSPYGNSNFSIGGADVLPGRVPLDIMSGLLSPGYIESRFTWAAIAILIAVLAGLVYRPHRATKPRWYAKLANRLTVVKAPPVATALTPAASLSHQPALSLVVAEFRLIGGNRIMLALALLAAGFGLMAKDNHLASAAPALWLVFALTAHAGHSETRGLLALTATMPFPPTARRLAFVIAGMAWALVMAAPQVLLHADIQYAGLALSLGVIIALLTTVFSSIAGSGFAARLLLLIFWYGYLSS